MADSPHDLGVYVHLPFCTHVCPYCDFAVEPVGRAVEGAVEQEYVELLLCELALLRERFAAELAGRTLATVYFGGGTPSLCSPASLDRVLCALRRAFGGPPREVTLEVNPGKGDTARMAEWRAVGISRLSVGLQAASDAALGRLGRAHSAAEGRRGLERCLAAGFESVSADLMYGIPAQSEAELIAGAALLLDLGVSHVSTYALTLEPGTPFARLAAQGRLGAPPDETVRRLGQVVRAHLAAAGCPPYEISSAARPGHEAVHNVRYWSRRSVLGLGVSAASLVGDLRFQNPRTRGEWAAPLSRGELPLRDLEHLGAREQQRETLALGLRRLAGVSRSAYRRRFGGNPELHFADELGELLRLELVARTGDRLRLTARGQLFADEVFLRFVGD